MTRSPYFWFVVSIVVGCAQPKSRDRDVYDILLHSPSLTEQREALTAILRTPQEYVPRIQQGLREYPRLLRTDWTAANRAVHVAALVRDSSFAPIIVDLLGDSAVLDECIYACPVVFALTIYSSFAGWTPPATLDTTLTTVTDLRASIGYVPRMSLEMRPIDSVVQGPALERHRKALEGKSEEQLIEMAGPASSTDVSPSIVAFALEASVVTSKNRIPLYLLLMNESNADASREYRGSIYQAIYRAETARVRGR